MRSFSSILLLTLVACSSAGSKAEEQYGMVERQSAPAFGMFKHQPRCEQAKVVAEAYLNEGNEEKYRQWDNKARDECALASNPMTMS